MTMGADQEALTLFLLGKPQILRGDVSLAERLAGKEQALFIYLACQPDQRYSREHLATLLWGETTHSRARYNLRRALWHLRGAVEEVGLDPDAILTTDESWIQLGPSAPCWVDVLDFEHVLKTAFQDLQSQFSSTSERVRRIQEALDLYRGEFLTGFSISNAPNFEEWLTLERERLFLLFLRALTSLIQGFIAWGERDEAIAACQRLLAADPLQEDIHRLLMRLYWETGQRTHALRQYHTYRDLLRRDLDIEPMEETRELYQRILQYEVSPVSISSLTLTSRLTPPAPSSDYLSRPRLLSLLDQGLSVRLTLLSAPPGYGKTTLLAQWMDVRVKDSADRDVLFAWYRVSEADNAPLTFVEGLATSVARLYPAVGEALREIYSLTALQGEPQRAAGLLVKTLGTLESVSLVIVLDDLEHLTSPDSWSVLRFLLKHLPVNGHLCLLTRKDPPLPLPRLRVRGQLLEIRAAELRFTEEEAKAFLAQASNLELNSSEKQELIDRAEGWAAPLWLAANAFGRFSATLDEVWDGLFAYLREEVLDAQRSEVRGFLLRSAVLNQLTPRLCQAVLDIYQDVTEMAEWLADLRRRNLFLHRISSQSPEREPTYAYQSLFLSFLRTELSRFLPSNEVRALHRRAARAWEQRGDQEQALYHFQQADDEPEVARLLGQMTSDYLQQGRLESLARWLDQLGPSVRSRYPRLTLSAGQLRQAEGRGEEARSLYLQAVADFEAQQDRAAQGDSLLALAELEFLRGRYDDGIQFGERALACWDETHNGRVADALCVLGRLRASLGDLPAAADSLERAERLARTGDDPLRVFRVLRSQAWVAYLQGAYHRAIGLNHWAEREAGDDVPQEIMMTFQNPVPSILRMWGQGDAAWHAAHRRLEAARQMRDRIALSSAWVDVGNLHWDRGVYSEAEEAFRKAVEGAKETGEDGLVRLCGEAHLACVCALRNNLNEAVELAEAMLSRCQDRGAPSLEIAIAQTALAGVHLRVPDVLAQDVFPALLKAYHIFKRLNVRYGVFASGILISRAYSQMNEAEPGGQARGYLVEALGMAAAESYIQPLVTWHDITLPLMLFALREGIGHRFVSSALARIGPEALPPVIELARDDDSLIRERAALALGVMRDEVEAGDVMDDEMYEPQLSSHP